MNPFAALTLVCLVAVAAPRWQGSAASLPADPDAFMKKVRDAARFDYEIQKEFTYLERRRDVRMSMLGKVTVGPIRTFEVYPSPIPGRTYKRLIAVDGKPLDPAELARRDAERQKSLREAEERWRAETARQRAERLEEEAEERREREAVLDDAIAVFHVTFTERTVIDGQPMLIGKATPRPDARVTTREGRWLKRFAGEIRVSEADHQIARLDMRAIDDVSIGWGIVGRVHKGSRFVFVRRKVDDTWLPAEVTFEASGRTMLFRKFQINTTTTFSDYRRVGANGFRTGANGFQTGANGFQKRSNEGNEGNGGPAGVPAVRPARPGVRELATHKRRAVIIRLCVASSRTPCPAR